VQSLWEIFVSSRTFWLAYVSAGTDLSLSASLRNDAKKLWAEPLCGGRVTFGLPGDFLLIFEISGGEHTLQLCGPDMENAMTVGTMDCHQMSDVFRWEEFVSVSKAVSSCVQPAWAVDLLLSYYVAVTADCAAEHSALLRRCLTAAEVFNGTEVDHIVRYSERVALRKDFRWIADAERGWVAEGRDAYCMRHTRGKFDFSTFRAFLGAAGADKSS
jgi:hypothetical protein